MKGLEHHQGLCVICWDTLNVPSSLFCCENPQHSVCAKCFSQIDKCPSCRNPCTKKYRIANDKMQRIHFREGQMRDMVDIEAMHIQVYVSKELLEKIIAELRKQDNVYWESKFRNVDHPFYENPAKNKNLTQFEEEVSVNFVDRKKFSTTINWPLINNKVEDIYETYIQIDIVCSDSYKKATKEWWWVGRSAEHAIATAGRNDDLFQFFFGRGQCKFKAIFYTKDEYTRMLWGKIKPVRYNGIKFQHPTSHGRELVDDLKDLKRAQRDLKKAQKQDLKKAQKQDLKKAQKHIAKAQQLHDLALAEALG